MIFAFAVSVSVSAVFSSAGQGSALKVGHMPLHVGPSLPLADDWSATLMLHASLAGEGWDSHCGGACHAQQGLQLQEVKLPQEVLRVLPGLHLLL